MVEEKILTINLKKEVLKKPKWKRSKQATLALKNLLKRYVKAEVKISKEVNELIWARGGRKPLTKIRIRLVKVNNFYEARLLK